MRPLGEVLLRLARRAAALAETRLAPLVVFLVALAAWWVEALVIPLGPGRDLGTYLGAYAQIFHSHPIDLGYVLGRTPIAPVIVGGLLDFAGGALAEPVVSLLFAGSVVALFLAARRFGAAAALLTAVVLLLYPGYAILFHELSSDAIFAAAFAGWSLLAVRILSAPGWRGFALLGAGVGILSLIRPGNLLLLALAVVPLLLRGAWRERALSAVAFAVPAVVLVAGWAIHNGIRYDNYTVARGGNATVPFYRVFVTDKLVRPSNGHASRELADAVRRDLLPQEPYRSYGITLDDFFAKASPRMQTDLLALSDRVKGWHSNYRWLRDVGVEAVRAHPSDYARGVAGSVWGLLTDGLYRPLSARGAPVKASPDGETLAAGGRSLPTPTEGEPIPAAHEGGVSTPDGSIYTVWTSPTEHHLVFVHPGDRERYDALHRRITELGENLPDRRGNLSLARRLNQASRWYPPPLLWLLLGLIGLAIRRGKGPLAVWVPALAAGFVVVLSALGLPAEPHYSVPVAPAFVLLAAVAVLAPRTELGALAVPRVPARAGAYAGLTAALLAAAWATKEYASRLHAAVNGGEAPHDLAVFLRAASKVLHGVSPYGFRGDETYAYPPLLGFLAVPFHALGTSAATVVWMIASLAAIAGALWLLGVRDWRCYALAYIFEFTRSAVDLGTVAPFLLLAVAVAWRWRDRLAVTGPAVGAAVALKLFLWPLAIWLALTRRIRAAGAAIGFALAFSLIPWAAIAFAGIAGYPSLLRHLSDDEATSSYSVVALAVRAHLPRAAGVALSLLAAAVLLMAAAWVARDERRTSRERDGGALTLTLAAALAASPIVWVHYFLFLLVPLALARPRLSPLWLVPLAYYPLGETAWPAGDGGKLTLALVTTLVVLGAALRRSATEVPREAPRPPRPAPSRPMSLTRAR